jgi:3-carboxy-cis,cis-muconate cycloisomerase
MPVRLTESLASTETVGRIFEDKAVVQAMLDFECALARVEERLGIIPAGCAELIASVAAAGEWDFDDLAAQSLRAGTPAIPLVRVLSQRTNGYVHWGATSQDVCDTAMVLLLLRQVMPYFDGLRSRLEQALRELSECHASTVMLGRTLLQPAPPVTFGLKAAGWMSSVRRGWERVRAAAAEALVLQFGGASGTLASLGPELGPVVSRELARELGLRVPDAPWHAHRDRLSALLSSFSILTGSLGKMALDIALLMQHETGEAAEPGGAGRGGSSAMPHKHNPTACLLTVSAARRCPGLLSNFLSAMLQEHERAAGGWQSEWPAITGMVEVTEGLRLDPARMRANLEATGGAVFAERAALTLASSRPELGGLEGAKREVEAMLRDGVLPGEFTKPEEYLGCAEYFRKRLLSPHGDEEE